MDEIVIRALGDQPAITGFRSTQLIAACPDRSGDIKGQTFATSGNPACGDFVVNAPMKTHPSRHLPAIVECGLKFVVAWIE